MAKKMNLLIITFIYLTFHIVLCEDKLFIRINNIDYLFELKNTEAANQIKSKLPFTHKMTNLNGNEVYYKFKDDFTKNEKSIGSINTGDIYLYQSDTLVLFYKSFSTSYKYTEIGKLVNSTNLAQNIGSGDVTVQWCSNICVDSFSFISTNYLLLLALILLLL